MITLIAAIDLNYGIASKGELLAIVSEDMIHFRKKTHSQIVVMGRTTWFSLPLREQKISKTWNTKKDFLDKTNNNMHDLKNFLKEVKRETHALKGRINIVITHKMDEDYYGATQVVDNIETIIELGKVTDIFIIGGASIYEQFYPYADVIELTVFDKVFEEADLFFPTIYYTDFKVESSCTLERENDFNLLFFTIVRIT